MFRLGVGFGVIARTANEPSIDSPAARIQSNKDNFLQCCMKLRNSLVIKTIDCRRQSTFITVVIANTGFQ